MIVIAGAGCLVLKTILQFQLRVWCKTIGCSDVDPTEVLTPANIMAVAIIDIAEELLVPTKRAKELRSKFVFRFHVISECVCVSYSRYLESRFVKLDPYLQMAPCKTGILPKNKLTIIIDITSRRQRWFRLLSYIWAISRCPARMQRLV